MGKFAAPNFQSTQGRWGGIAHLAAMNGVRLIVVIIKHPKPPGFCGAETAGITHIGCLPCQNQPLPGRAFGRANASP
ncbi:MAG TPA: hypothetical protein PLB25_06050 [Rhodoferax sp.]|nr:hypothetical protein [Rhodoferax sp.]